MEAPLAARRGGQRVSLGGNLVTGAAGVAGNCCHRPSMKANHARSVVEVVGGLVTGRTVHQRRVVVVRGLRVVVGRAHHGLCMVVGRGAHHGRCVTGRRVVVVL